MLVTDQQELYNSRAWPVKHAKDIIKYIEQCKPNKQYILLETGYGPSGLPHLGTPLETARTSFIASVLQKIQNKPVIMLSVIDDMDGFRKVPAGLPNQDMLYKYLNQPLYSIPDPYNQYESFADYNISKFIQLTEDFGYDVSYIRFDAHNRFTEDKLLQASNHGRNIVVVRASDLYKTGVFNAALQTILEKHEDVLKIILPTLGEERQKTYSPFMPISKLDGRVLQNEVCAYNVDNNTVTVNDNGDIYDISVLDGHCKLQWKIDFGMRWAALDVDYELSGKDINIGTVPIAKQVSQLISGQYPVTKVHEMLLSEDGAKMSKSKGSAIDVHALIRYCGPNVIRYFMMSNPESAHKISMSKITQYIDAYQQDLQQYIQTQDIENKVFYSDLCIMNDIPNPSKLHVADIMGMIECVHSEDIQDIIDKFDLDISDVASIEILYRLNKFYHEQSDAAHHITIDEWMKEYFTQVIDIVTNDTIQDLSTLKLSEGDNASENDCDTETYAQRIQTQLYELGKRAIHDGHYKNLKEWFKCLYQIIFHKDTGPKLGSFFAMQKDKKKLRDLLECKLQNT